ncbi:VWA domain-containing protein [Biformimicrobium ophioploci]|uniref:VWA domain-containing protein n=1 Tax=Biformimicrobium ophioploci TaxID=3036711 RepID=A0ABQ6LUP8_9GAMM|nr:VWA domain-containing protein [Microbulbifer sp. NKW57]GMG85811.1 VWA domain-containing protein [Microbulbifer sp. NKW57]
MISFAWPWALLLLPLPLLVHWLVPAHTTTQTVVQAPFFTRLARLSRQRPGEGAVVLTRQWPQWLQVGILWLLVVLACARPQWLGEPVPVESSGRDMMLAVDLSGSMDTEDFIDASGKTLRRIDGVKKVLADFVSRREGDRLGLLVFGSSPFVQAPFSADTAVFLRLLSESEVGMAGPKTMLGDAIGKAVQHFDSADAQQRTLILLTDGNDSGSRVPPGEAARIAASKDIVIHVVAVGDPAAAGEEALDVDAMRAITDATGGQYFHALKGADLAPVYQRLDALEPAQFAQEYYRPRTELYYLPLLVAALAALLFQSLQALLSLRKTGSIKNA